MSKITRCLIIDDEELAIKVIESHIEKIDSLEVAASCQNAYDAFNVLNKVHVDLIFLDIQMPQLTGLDFIKSLNQPPQIILTTAYRDYAPEGFDLDVLDYLLKPISFGRFLKAVGKVTRAMQPIVSPDPVKREQNHKNAYIFVKCGKSMEKVCYKDVVYIESFRDFVKIHTEKKIVTTYLKIGFLEEKLPKELFIRVHKSFIIAIAKITAYTSNDIEMESSSVPIGNFYKKNVLDRLGFEGRTL